MARGQRNHDDAFDEQVALWYKEIPIPSPERLRRSGRVSGTRSKLLSMKLPERIREEQLDATPKPRQGCGLLRQLLSANRKTESHIRQKGSRLPCSISKRG